jgi:hypothetical protein
MVLDVEPDNAHAIASGGIPTNCNLSYHSPKEMATIITKP